MSEGEKWKWKLPPSDEIRKMRRKALRELIHDFIEHAERGDANRTGGGVELAIFRAQYLTQELVRRTQNWQTGAIIVMTALIMAMTLVIAANSLPSHAP